MTRPPTTTAPPPLSTDEYAAIWRELVGRRSELAVRFAELDARKLAVHEDERARLDELTRLVHRVHELSGLGGFSLTTGLVPVTRPSRPLQ